MGKHHPLLALALFAWTSSGCGSAADVRHATWTGQIDTLPDGQIVVQNLGSGFWPEGAEWSVIEDLRIGTIDLEGPQNFGRISSIAVDHVGRLWVLESQSSELRVFSPSGDHIRTVGREGSGPGEFKQPVRVDVGPEGRVWVMDPQNARLSVFDSAGSYIEGLQAPGGFVIMPWQGGFDRQGNYYSQIIEFEPEFRIALGRFDRAYNPLDTIELPTDPVERDAYTIVSEGRTRVVAGVPFQGGLKWRLSSSGTVWALFTDQYRMFEIAANGDTLRSVTKNFDPVAVTSQDLTDALDGLKWFTDQGGRVDRSRIPDHKPAARSFFLDDQDHVWVERITAQRAEDQSFDIFNPTGQYLGTVVTPFKLEASPIPFVREGALYGVIRDELDVPFVVRARIVRQ